MDKRGYLNLANQKHPGYLWKAVEIGERSTLVVSDLMPMKSNAGHYVGRYCVEFKEGQTSMVEPWSRETTYYPSKEAVLEACDEDDIIVRDCTENNAMYRDNTNSFEEPTSSKLKAVADVFGMEAGEE